MIVPATSPSNWRLRINCVIGAWMVIRIGWSDANNGLGGAARTGRAGAMVSAADRREVTWAHSLSCHFVRGHRLANDFEPGSACRHIARNAGIDAGQSAFAENQYAGQIGRVGNDQALGPIGRKHGLELLAAAWPW